MIVVKAVLGVIGCGAFLWWVRRSDLRRMRRCEAEGDEVWAERARMRVEAFGATVVIAVVALPIPLVLGALGVPRAIPVLTFLALVVPGVKAVNALARRRPDLVLPHIRWPDELRTLGTPVGRVGAATAALAVFALIAALASGG